jgi:hypothetical protein
VSGILKCELCRKEAKDGARLCESCAEMVQRIATATHAVTGTSETSQEEGDALRKKSERALAKAEKITPFILG